MNNRDYLLLTGLLIFLAYVVLGVLSGSNAQRDYLDQHCEQVSGEFTRYVYDCNGVVVLYER